MRKGLQILKFPGERRNFRCGQQKVMVSLVAYLILSIEIAHNWVWSNSIISLVIFTMEKK